MCVGPVAKAGRSAGGSEASPRCLSEPPSPPRSERQGKVLNQLRNNWAQMHGQLRSPADWMDSQSPSTSCDLEGQTSPV